MLDTRYYNLNLISPMGPGREIYWIPLGTPNICSVLYMNEALVTSLGFSTLRTYEDLVAMVPSARAAGLDVISIDGADGWAWNICLLSAIIACLSGDPRWVSRAVAGQYKFTDQPFVDSLALIRRMTADGVISDQSILVDYGSNIINYDHEKALFMIQGQWAASSLDDKVAAHTRILSCTNCSTTADY